ncbi:MAG: hypothetical protein U0792_10430 [Gemmataceae bacterium]
MPSTRTHPTHKVSPDDLSAPPPNDKDQPPGQQPKKPSGIQGITPGGPIKPVFGINRPSTSAPNTPTTPSAQAPELDRQTCLARSEAGLVEIIIERHPAPKPATPTPNIPRPRHPVRRLRAEQTGDAECSRTSSSQSKPATPIA